MESNKTFRGQCLTNRYCKVELYPQDHSKSGWTFSFHKLMGQLSTIWQAKSHKPTAMCCNSHCMLHSQTSLMETSVFLWLTITCLLWAPNQYTSPSKKEGRKEQIAWSATCEKHHLHFLPYCTKIENEGNWLQNHLWCPNKLHSWGIDDDVRHRWLTLDSWK